MAYTVTDQIPDLALFQWGTPDNPNPKLSAPLGDQASDDTITVTSAPLDHDGNVISTDFIMKVVNAQSYVENIFVPASGISASGLTFTGVTRGLRLEGLDYTTSDTDLIAKHGSDSVIGCNVNAVYANIVHACLQGSTVSTGGLSFALGDGTDTNVTIKHLETGGEKGFLRKNKTTSKVEYSNDGTVWTSIDAVVAGSLVVVSAGDTTPGNLEDKMTAGSGIILTKLNAGGNEELEVTADIAGAAIDEPDTYTPAYLTGGTSPTSNHLLWTGTADGSFRVTLDGTIRDVTTDFTTATSMADVASLMQTALRVLTGDLVTIAWTTRFIITSASTSSSSAITVLSATGTGTDVSGAGAFDGMDSDTGNGVVTDAVINQPADAGKIVKLDATGKFNEDFGTWAKESTLTAKGSMYAADGAGSPVEVAVGTDGQVLVVDSSEATGVKWENSGMFADTATTPFISVSGNYDLTFTPGFEAGVIEVHFGNIDIDGQSDDRQVFGKLVFNGTTFKFRHVTTTLGYSSATPVFSQTAIGSTNLEYRSRDNAGDDEWGVLITIVDITSTQFTVRITATDYEPPPARDISAIGIGVIAHRA